MSKQSEAVKRWRKNCKARIVEAFGGCCCICKYNKCQEALALHHRDPLQKDIALGAIRASPRSWERIIVELRKCVLICHNCHTELHNNIINLTGNESLFNEVFADYKSLLRKEQVDPCPVCGKDKPKKQVTCSYQCVGKLRQRINWSSINLEEELKTKTKTEVAEQLGCTEAAVRKRILRHGYN